MVNVRCFITDLKMKLKFEQPKKIDNLFNKL